MELRSPSKKGEGGGEETGKTGSERETKGETGRGSHYRVQE